MPRKAAKDSSKRVETVAMVIRAKHFDEKVDKSMLPCYKVECISR
jgi:hypothetical protein